MERLEGERALHAYRLMRLIRRFEENVRELVNANEIPGVCHECVGQEAVAAGVGLALRRDDVITSTHRGHGHIIGKGGRADRMMAELFGRATGYNRGKGGSMHIPDHPLKWQGRGPVGLLPPPFPRCPRCASHIPTVMASLAHKRTAQV